MPVIGSLGGVKSGVSQGGTVTGNGGTVTSTYTVPSGSYLIISFYSGNDAACTLSISSGQSAGIASGNTVTRFDGGVYVGGGGSVTVSATANKSVAKWGGVLYSF